MGTCIFNEVSANKVKFWIIWQFPRQQLCKSPWQEDWKKLQTSSSYETICSVFISLHCSQPKYCLNDWHSPSANKCRKACSDWAFLIGRIPIGFLHASQLVQFLCVTVGRRLDMSKFTEGSQRLRINNSERVVCTWKPSLWMQTTLREFIESQSECVCM